MNNLQAVSETRTKTLRRAAWAGLLVLAVSAFAMVAIPVKLIMPFSAQSQGGLSLSYTLRHWSPSFTLIAALVAIALVLWLWRGARWWRRIVSVLVLIPVFAATWFARQNHFEWMFNPLANPAYAKRRSRIRKKSRHGDGCRQQRRGSRLSDSPDGLSSSGPGHGRRHADRRHLLNALSHRSGVGNDSRRTASSFPSRGNQQSKLHHAR